MLKSKSGQLPWYVPLKIEKPRWWHALQSKEGFPLVHLTLFLLHICSFTVQISSHLRFTEPLFKCVYVLHMTVCLEQSEYTIFEEIWNDVNPFWSFLVWVPAAVHLRFWCIMYYYEVSLQPSTLEFFPTGEKMHTERWGNDLTAEITVGCTFDVLPFLKVCENVMWIKSPLKEKHTYLSDARKKPSEFICSATHCLDILWNHVIN